MNFSGKEVVRNVSQNERGYIHALEEVVVFVIGDIVW